MNQFMLGGRLGGDPEVKYTKGGMAITTISIATNGREKKGDEYENVTHWHRVKFLGKRAETVGQHFSKGQWINTWGILKPFKYEKEGGDMVYGVDNLAEGFDFVEKKGAGGGGGGSSKPQGKSSSSMSDDELPF